MKKLLLIVCAAAMFAATSCQAVLESISNSINFVFADATVYDGQTALLGLTYKDAVDWTIDSDSKAYVSIEHNSDGKNCVAKFILPPAGEKRTKVHLTTRARNDSSIKPFEGTITIAPWRVFLYKKAGSNLTPIGTSVSIGVHGTGTYVARMEYLNEKEQWVELSSVIYRLDLLSGLHRVAWESSGEKHFVEPKEITDCSVEFTVNAAPVSICRVMATLGRDRDASGNSVGISKDGKKVTHYVEILP
ncbi:MAG: hypothetical protein J6Y31_01495 [Bacteroidales bacterium]|nr:hypothetical protein [Bacteroidales bacterium]